MKPDPWLVLDTVSQRLLLELGPSLGDGYGQSTLQVEAVLLMAMREEFDRAAARRIEENRAMRALFADATALASVAADDGLVRRLGAAARAGEESLTVSALDESNRALRGLLIELHAHVETSPDPGARLLEERIWLELSRSTERRRLSMAIF